MEKIKPELVGTICLIQASATPEALKALRLLCGDSFDALLAEVERLRKSPESAAKRGKK